MKKLARRAARTLAEHSDGAASKAAGALTLELVVAMAILVAVLMPIAFSFAHEQKLCRAYYYRAVVMELIDGELEVLSAGEWKMFKPGPQAYRIRGPTADKLPPGKFQLMLDSRRIRLEWTPAKRGYGGRIEREVALGSERQ